MTTRPTAGIVPWLRRAGLAFTAFLGSFLLFLIQPAAAKALLPGFGGSFMVWAAALTFFQGMLFLGYLLAHLLFGGIVTRPRMLLFIVASWAAAGLFRFSPEALAAGPGNSPFLTAEIGLLLYSIGIPVLMLTAGTVTLQRWYQVTPGLAVETASSLYAASNAGSLLALLAFPLLLEPHLEIGTLTRGWLVLYLAWGVLLAVVAPWNPARECAWEELSATGENSEKPHASPLEEITSIALADDREAAAAFSPTAGSLYQSGRWLLAAGAGSMLLSATTNLLTLDLASMPLLWILPLAVYLASWIRAFGATLKEDADDDTLAPTWFASAACLFYLTNLGFSLGALILLSAALLIQYQLSVRIHRTLAATVPHDGSHLSRFYLVLAAGGWAGSALVSFVIPLLPAGLIEYPLALFFAAAAVWPESPNRLDPADPGILVRIFGILFFVFLLPMLAAKGLPMTGSLLVAASAGACVYIFLSFREAGRRECNRLVTAGVMVFALLCLDAWGSPGRQLERTRTWYGLYRVFDQHGLRSIEMGSTLHGCESFRPVDRGRPVLYYHPETPIAGLLSATTASQAEKIAIVGLGAGTLAAFGFPGQTYDFYELDPGGEALARRWFGYLASSAATVRVIPGDGRTMLRQATAPYDLIVLDAFNSDSIPIHLLTREAMAEFRARLKEDGLLVFHLSNRHLNLAPILVGAATDLGLEVRLAANRAIGSPISTSPELSAEESLNTPFPAAETRWLAVGGSGITRHLASLPEWQPPERFASGTVRFWTDRFSSLFPLLLAGPWDPGSAEGLVCNRPAKGH